MTSQQIFVSGVLVAVFALFLWGRWRHDVVAFGALLAVAIAGLIPPREVFAGFGHTATVTVALVLIISRGLQSSGAVDLIARYLIPAFRSTSAHVGALSTVGSALSAVMNNVGALALLMPAAIQSAKQAKRSATLLLLPLSFGSILGGLITLIGTPPNIIIAAFREESLGSPFGMFDFTPVGGAVAVVGLAFVALLGWRLIPAQRKPAATPGEVIEIDNYLSEARVPEESKAAGRPLSELDDEAAAHDASLVATIRGHRRIEGRRHIVQPDDVIIVDAPAETLGPLLRELGLEPIAASGEEDGHTVTDDLALAEALVSPGAPLLGRLAGSLRLKTRFGISLLAVSRAGEPRRGRLATFRFQVGDVLLLEGDAERLPEVIATLGCLPLAPRGLAGVRPGRAGLAIGLFVAAIGCATVGLVSLPVGLAFAAAAMVVGGMVPLRDLYTAVDWPVVVLLGAMIPVGGALQSTGTTALLAHALISVSAGFAPIVVLALLLVITMTLSDVINNAATAVVMGPIALAVAAGLEVSPDPFLMAVAIGASCAFLTPIGHQNNMLVMGPGGYRFGDYWRVGLPLEILIVAVSVPMLLVVWPL